MNSFLPSKYRFAKYWSHWPTCVPTLPVDQDVKYCRPFENIEWQRPSSRVFARIRASIRKTLAIIGLTLTKYRERTSKMETAGRAIINREPASWTGTGRFPDACL